jgi:hypothetical protein
MQKAQSSPYQCPVCKKPVKAFDVVGDPQGAFFADCKQCGVIDLGAGKIVPPSEVPRRKPSQTKASQLPY